MSKKCLYWSETKNQCTAEFKCHFFSRVKEKCRLDGQLVIDIIDSKDSTKVKSANLNYIPGGKYADFIY